MEAWARAARGGEWQAAKEVGSGSTEQAQPR